MILVIIGDADDDFDLALFHLYRRDTPLDEILRRYQRSFLCFANENVKRFDNSFKKNICRASVVPVHARETIGPGLMSKILRDCEIPVEDIKAFL